jgi:signal transduction histidine kinase
MGVRSRRGVALAAALVIGALAAAFLLLSGRLAGTDAMRGADLVWFLSFLTFPVVGFVICWHRPDHTIGWVYLGIGLTQTVAGTSGLVAEWATSARPGASVGAWASLTENLCFGASWVLASTFALLLYPDGHLPSRRWRWLAWLSAAGLGLASLALVVSPARIDAGLGLTSPLAVESLREWPQRVVDGAVVVLLCVTIFALVSLVVRWRRSRGEARRRMVWLGLAATVALIAVALLVVSRSWAPDWAGALVEALIVAVIPVATGIAVLRNNLFDVEAVLDKTLVYAVLTGLVLATYFVTVSLGTGLLGDDAGRGASLLATAAVAVTLSPLKERLHRLVERGLYGERSQPYHVLAGLAATLERTTALDELLGTVTETVTRALRLPWVEVSLDHSTPAPDGAIALPLIAHGTPEGVLLVGRRPGQSAFDPRELQLLDDLARQVAREVRLARLASDLQDSREGLVRAREDERLRVRRDLHDEIGPTLAAASLQVDALRARWQPDDPRVSQLLGKVKDEIAKSVLDVRRVVEGLRPPALDDLGLVGVVREHAATLSAAGLAVDVHCPEQLVVPSAAAEVAAYRIVTEAITNVVRHSGARACKVSLAVVDDWLVLEVADDGVGSVGSSDGVGRTSMRERAAELGGTTHFEERPGGGTVVTARLPLQREAAT